MPKCVGKIGGGNPDWGKMSCPRGCRRWKIPNSGMSRKIISADSVLSATAHRQFLQMPGRKLPEIEITVKDKESGSGVDEVTFPVNKGGKREASKYLNHYGFCWVVW